MAFWCRIKQSNLRSLSHQFQRWYFQAPGARLVSQSSPHARALIVRKPRLVVQRSPVGFCSNVRFFAVPFKGTPKKEEKDSDGPRMNEEITAEFIRLVTDDGHSVLPKREALERARKLKLDLVEVQRNGKPPVCKIMDFNREKFVKETKEKERAKCKSEVTLKKGVCKEVRFSGKTEQKDLQMKADLVKRLMEKGCRVKCIAMGKEDEDLRGFLLRISDLIEDFSVIESGPSVEKKSAYLIARHVKFGPLKKGPGKKASIVDAASSPEDVEMPNKDLDKENSTWLVLDADKDDLDGMFDVEGDEMAPISSGTKDSMPTQGRQSHFGSNFASAVREDERTGANAPDNDFSKQKWSRPSAPSSSGTGYGVFSYPKLNDTRQIGVPTEGNRYKKGNTLNSTRPPRPGGTSTTENPTTSGHNTGGRPGIAPQEGRRWGVFSGDSSKMTPNRNFASRANVQR